MWFFFENKNRVQNFSASRRVAGPDVSFLLELRRPPRRIQNRLNSVQRVNTGPARSLISVQTQIRISRPSALCFLFRHDVFKVLGERFWHVGRPQWSAPNIPETMLARKPPTIPSYARRPRAMFRKFRSRPLDVRGGLGRRMRLDVAGWVPGFPVCLSISAKA